MDPVEQLFERAVDDRRHGAAEIERRLLRDLLEARREWTADGLTRGADRLTDGQPAMANLRRLAHELARPELAEVESRLRHRLAVLDELGDRLAAAAWPLLDGVPRVLTLSRSSAVAAVLLGAWRRGWRGETLVFDGSPAGGGADQAAELARTMDRVRSLPDAVMRDGFEGASTRVVVGADAVGRDRFVNVSGTALLVELAAARAVPVTLVADTGKNLAEDELDEILAALPTAGDGAVGRRWPLFEPVPLELVTDRVTEGE